MIHFQKSASNVVKKASNVVILVKKETRRRKALAAEIALPLALVGGFVSLVQ